MSDPTVSKIFGPILDKTDVENAMEEHLRLWLPTYLAELERQKGYEPETIRTPVAWLRSNDFSKWPEDHTPAILIISPGLVGDPTREGSSVWSAPYGVGVAAVVSSIDRDSTRKLAGFYGAAIRAAVLQHPSLGNFARDTNWVDERFDDVPQEDERSLASAQEVFRVDVFGVTAGRTGPKTPPEDPYAIPADPPIATERNIDTQWLEEEL